MDVTIKKLSPLGAEILGADIEALLNDKQVPALVLDALEENGVLVFPELGLDDAQQVAFALRLGDIVTRSGPGTYGRGTEHPEIYHVGFSDELNNELQVKGAFLWHIDGTTDEIPSKASLLTGRSIAASGGDTTFVSTYAAYDRLSGEEKVRFAGLKVLHSLESAYRHFDPNPTPEIVERLRAVAPMIHPSCGRTALGASHSCWARPPSGSKGCPRRRALRSSPSSSSARRSPSTSTRTSGRSVTW